MHDDSIVSKFFLIRMIVVHVLATESEVSPFL